MNEQWNQALSQIHDKHIAEAASPPPRRWPYWVGAVAAVLALAIGWSILWQGLSQTPAEPGPAILQTQPTIPGFTSPFVTDPTPPSITPPLVTEPTPPSVTSPFGTEPTSPIVTVPQIAVMQLAQPVYPQISYVPNRTDYKNYIDYYQALSEHNQAWKNHYSQPQGYADSLNDFFHESIREFLSGEGNQAYSPVNVYLALAMLAQTTGGNSQQQILDLLRADSMEALRTQAGHVWNAQYRDDGVTKLLLANSVWLDGAHGFNADTVQTLADSFYASVFGGDLGSEEMNQQLRQWLNEQTGNLLTDQTQNLKLDPNSVFALASTIYFKANWIAQFGEKNTAYATFRAPGGDVTVRFMNSTRSTQYYWGPDFTAVRLTLEGGNTMWLILPDEGKSVQDVLSSDAYLTMTRDKHGWEQQAYVQVNLSLPKFDISSNTNLIPGIKKLGVTDIFSPSTADMTPMTDASGVYVGKVEHAVRLSADETGVLGTAYTVIDAPENGPPLKDEVDFVLDRPFLFLVTSQDSIPLFTGIVANP